jgi:hypothetical protein
MSALNGLAALLDGYNARISALEAKVGIKSDGATSASLATPAAAATPANAGSSGGDDDPRLAAFDEVVTKYGEALRDVSAKIGGDAKTVVSVLTAIILTEARS